MALEKSSIPINFAQGLDTKSDPKQVQLGRFSSLQNSVFTKVGLLQKRNGYHALTALPDASNGYLTTYNGNLTAVGTDLVAYSDSTDTWVTKGALEPVTLDTVPLIRSNLNQTQSDTAIASNGLICTVYTDSLGGSVQYKYAVANSVTGQNVLPPTAITPSTGVVTGSPRVFLLGSYFLIVFTRGVSNLEYIAVSTGDPSIVTAAATIAAGYTATSALSWDGAVSNNFLYIAYNTTSGGQAVRMTYLSSTLSLAAAVTFAGSKATVMSVTVDEYVSSAPVIYASFYNVTANDIHTLAVYPTLATALAPTSIATSVTVNNITSVATNSLCTVYYEIANDYTFSSSIPNDSSNATNYITVQTITSTGTTGTPTVLKRSVGLASKAFLVSGYPYLLATYVSLYQPTYFLIDHLGNIVSKLAYSNGGGYLTLGLPSVSVSGTTASISYRYKDLVEAVNKTQGSGVSAGVYSQTGINLVNFNIGAMSVVSAEIGNNLNLTGGYLTGYDGYVPVENGFHVWPDHIGVSSSGTSFYYQVTYEWADNQGNVYRSAPSVPVGTGAGVGTVIKVPTLRLTAKTANPVKIVIYRWSTSQTTYYQTTSTTTPLLNDPTVDSVSFTDPNADAAILGNNILYTTGGVVENIGPPACDTLTLYRSRLILLDAEDKNLLWYSKQVIEATPVEMSDLFTIYVAPTTGSQGSTGPIKALSALDDKLVIFKRDAIYYLTGTGPDNTGANNDFGEPVFVTSTVGSSNQKSIVFMPQGLMFESDKGIWLLDRSLNTTYIGAPVETLTTGATVQSSVNVPGTNQVRFTMSSGITLVYDYYYGQWGSFVNVPAISSTLYQNLHTYINELGQVFQETPGLYLDGSNPVLMSFTTGWLNLGGLQGFERAYEFFLLGTYITPHLLQCSIAYDYSSAPSQTSVVTPDNYNGSYGSDTTYGGSSPYGGNSALEQWRVFLQRQKCQAFQITITEVYDASYGVGAGAGLTLSGLDLTVGVKGGRPRLRGAVQVG